MKTNSITNTDKAVKLYNTITGLWFRAGQNFNEECLFKATPLSTEQAAFVRAIFESSTIGQHIVGSLMDGDIPECGCDKCESGE